MGTGTLVNPLFESELPPKVYRRPLVKDPHRRRLCRDNRPYMSVPYTVPGVVTTGDYQPMWRVDRPYWVANITANIGKHDSGTHPNDGTPAGSTLECNLRRVTADLTNDSPIISADARLSIDIDQHQDWVNDNEDGAYVQSDFAIPTLDTGEHVYLRVGQVGSTRPGSFLVVTLVLVPIR